MAVAALLLPWPWQLSGGRAVLEGVCCPHGDSVEMEHSCLQQVTDDRAPAMASSGPWHRSQRRCLKAAGGTRSGRGAGEPRTHELGQGEL